MFDTLQPSSLIPYSNETRKTEPVSKPAVVIPINTGIKKRIPPKKKKAAAPLNPLFKDWNLPQQAEGYIKCGKFDFL